ncbi:hypothetical protein [Sinomonas terrae]|uniref:Uncharacterized protein n=1 Tax=Sinomonas terrae TaxID=2908838 RepID=A0ABS9TZJ7_9MICC|nr:hypothetical protein [Sinomonas terrae]MCH6469854.1 hypothetical protein [Sinomonas terrae]
MIDRQGAEGQRDRIEKAARELAPGERLWFEVRCARRTGRARWKAVVCRPEEVRAEFAAAGRGSGAAFDLDCPSQLVQWLEALRVRPVQPVPDDWNHLVFFGSDVEVY